MLDPKNGSVTTKNTEDMKEKINELPCDVARRGIHHNDHEAGALKFFVFFVVTLPFLDYKDV